MSRANDPAFPLTEPKLWKDGANNYVLSVREHFAAMAMQAIIGTSAAPCLTSFGGCEPNIAETAVGMADALIAELEKPTKPKPDSGADIDAYLAERIEWLEREIKNGGNYTYLSDKKSENEYVLKNVREIRARNKQ